MVVEKNHEDERTSRAARADVFFSYIVTVAVTTAHYAVVPLTATSQDDYVTIILLLLLSLLL